MVVVGLGAVFFGLIVGWIVYRILRYQTGPSWRSDLIALLGLIAGVIPLAFFRDEVLFGWYAIGLVIGFVASIAVGVLLYGKREIHHWQSEPLPPTTSSEI